MKKTILACFLTMVFLCTGTLTSCTNPDDYIFDERDTTTMTVRADMARYYDTTAYRVKSDTVMLGDSILFIASITPSKSTRTKSSFWLFDNKFFASEFNVQETITQPGYHEIVFVLIDIFGDSLTDTLHLWVSTYPKIDTANFIPAKSTQGLPSRKPIQFSWDASDNYCNCELYYHFTLTNLIDEENGEMDLIDTIIKTPYFVLDKELKALSLYKWKVQAFNEYKTGSQKTIEADFSTLGNTNESGISGRLETSSDKTIANFDIIVLDASNTPTGIKTSLKKKSGNGLFTIKSLSQGTYKITARSSEAPDYKTDTVTVSVGRSSLVNIGTMLAEDKTAPTITVDVPNDTIDFTEYIDIHIHDGSAESVPTETKVFLGDKQLKTVTETEDGIRIQLQEKHKSWVPQILTIIATDGSNNFTKKTLIIRPSDFWFDINNDTTISEQAEISIFVKDHNPYNFELYTCTINRFDDYRGIIKIDARNLTALSYPISARDFPNAKNNISITLEYDEGIEQTRYWNLTINKAPKMEKETHCLYPCNSYINTSSLFQWNPANDPENDDILYRLIYVRDSNHFYDESKYVYATDFIEHNQVYLQNLPEGALYWWVEAKDSYGGVSTEWEEKAFVMVMSNKTSDTDSTLKNTQSTKSSPEGSINE